MSEELVNFKKKYRAHIKESHMRYAVPKRMSIDPLSLSTEPFDLKFEYERGVQIDMSKSDFETLIEMEAYFNRQLQNQNWENFSGYANSIVKQHEREMRIRNNNPAVRKAYEKYQTLMRLVDTKYNR